MNKKIPVFNQLLESIKTNCPGVITEEVETQMKQLFSDAVDNIEKTASEEGYNLGQKLGFQAGYLEGKRIAALKAKEEIDKIVEKCDDLAVQKLQEILTLIDENNTAKLEEVYQLLQQAKQEAEQAKQLTELAKALTEKALQEQDAEHTKQLQDVVDMYNDHKAMTDEDYANKLETAIKAKDEADAAMLQKAIDAKDEADTAMLKTYAESIDKKHALAMEEIIQKMDENYANKLETAIKAKDEADTAMLKTYAESVDKKHALAMEEIIQKIDECNAKKLEEVVSLIKESANKRMKKMQTIYENELKAEKLKKVEILAESVEKYLNYALEKHLPKKQLVSEAKYLAALKSVEKITDVLKVNSIVQESKDEVFQDYEKEIANAKSINNKLISLKIELADKLQKQEAKLLLESKLQKSTPALANFLREYFKNAKSPRIIEESIEDAKASFRKIQSEKRAKLQAIAKNNKPANVKPSLVVTESVKKSAIAEVKESPKKIAENSQKQDNIAEYYAQYLVKTKI